MRASPAIRRSTTPARRRAASGRRPTAAQRWAPVFDSQPVAAIGALAVAPSDPNIVWAGTGEAWAIRDSDVIGDGIYKSTDAGTTWTHMGLDETGRIGRIIVHPTNPDIVYACAIGRITGAAAGARRLRPPTAASTGSACCSSTTNTGCSGLSMDAKNPRTLFAGTWQVEMHPWAMLSGGPGSGIYVSRDGGANWTQGRGGTACRKSPLGKIDVAVAPSDSNRVYALIQTADQGSVWRSDDGGASWRVVNWSRDLIGRAGYYIHLAVSPGQRRRNPRRQQLVLPVGRRRPDLPQPCNWGGDNHDIWWDPKNADRFAITHDAGMHDHDAITAGARSACSCRSGRCITSPSTTRCRTTSTATCRTTGRCAAQHSPEAVATTHAAAARRGRAGRRRRRTRRRGVPWDHGLGGCESGFTVPDPTDPNIVWATCYGNKVTRYDAEAGDRALGRAVDDHARLAADRTRSTAATGRRRWRSIRSITTTSTTAAR